MSQSQARILVVDDNAMNLKLMRLTLADHGYRVATADSAEAALQHLGIDRPDLVLLDIQLPGMDGLALARVLKNDPAHRDIGIIAVTAFAAPADEERAYAAGCDGFVRKPIDTRALPGLIAEALRMRGASRAGAGGSAIPVPLPLEP